MADISKIKVNSTTYNLKDSRIPALNSSTTQFLRGDGTWATPTVSEITSTADVTDDDTGMIIEPGSGGGGNYQAKTNIDPTTSSQTIYPDTGYDALSSVQINAMPQVVKTATGTFTGNGTRTVDISCNFEPDIIYWTSDPGTTASSGTVGGIIVREMMAANRYRNNTTTNSHYAVLDITAMNTGGSSYSFRATYTNSTVTLYCFSNNARSLFTSGRTYSYTFLKWTT